MRNNNNTISKQEKNFIAALEYLKAEKFTREALIENRVIYNTVAETVFSFVHFLLHSKRNLDLMKGSLEEIDSIADECTIKILNKLDYFLSERFTTEMVIKMVIKIVNNNVIDMTYRKEKKHINRQVFSSDDDDHSDIISSIASDENIENDVIEHLMSDIEATEKHQIIVAFLSGISSCSLFEIISFLGTKIIVIDNNKPIKTGALALLIDKLGLEKVATMIFELAAQQLCLEVFFDDLEFSNSTTPEYKDVKCLAEIISKASFNAKRKMMTAFKKREKKIAHIR